MLKSAILVMGALGQIGRDLTVALKQKYPEAKIITSDIRESENEDLDQEIFEHHDCTDITQTARIVKKYDINTIYHLPALLSATAEEKPQDAFSVNVLGLYNTLEVAREYGCSVFNPSTIGVFGETTPQEYTPQDTLMRPSTMYGVTKVSGELLCDYYFGRYGIDVRGLRLPGIISHKVIPTGGTTDFAVKIFFDAVKLGFYTSYIRPNTFLDMVYMPDVIEAIINLMEANPKQLKHRNAFNITSMSVDVELLAKEIRNYIPNFKLTYDIDPLRQKIADSWPNSLDDSEARKQWNWSPQYDLKKMVEDMLKNIKRNDGKSR